MEPIQIAILGLGTVGASTVNVLQRNQDEIRRRLGREVHILGVCARDQDKKRLCRTDNLTFFSPQELVEHPGVDIVVELIGGQDQAKDSIIRALQAKKHVVTANKALIAEQGGQLFDLALKNQCVVAFEAAVAGGIPIIKAIREGMGGNRIQSLVGIINGTCNYILSKMLNERCSFEEALLQAQAMGFAESDPTFDLQGVDAAHKLSILASIAFGIPLQFDRVYREGIQHIEPIDIAFAQDLGFTIKQLGVARKDERGVELRVQPSLIPVKHMLASVDNAMNAVLMHADAVGPTLYYGQGAGGEPTASAVVADILEVARLISVKNEQRVPALAFQSQSLGPAEVLPFEQARSSAYLRLNVHDKPGMLAAIASILSDCDISIETLLQKQWPKQRMTDCVPLVMLTHPITMGRLQQAIKCLESTKGIEGKVQYLNVEVLT